MADALFYLALGVALLVIVIAGFQNLREIRVEMPHMSPDRRGHARSLAWRGTRRLALPLLALAAAAIAALWAGGHTGGLLELAFAMAVGIVAFAVANYLLMWTTIRAAVRQRHAEPAD